MLVRLVLHTWMHVQQPGVVDTDEVDVDDADVGGADDARMGACKQDGRG